MAGGNACESQHVIGKFLLDQCGVANAVDVHQLFEVVIFLSLYVVIGIDFPGHPDLRRLLLAREWPKGVYPLRRDYEEWDRNAIRDRGV